MVHEKPSGSDLGWDRIINFSRKGPKHFRHFFAMSLCKVLLSTLIIIFRRTGSWSRESYFLLVKNGIPLGGDVLLLLHVREPSRVGQWPDYFRKADSSTALLKRWEE